jgi:membrane-associated protein
MSTLVDIFLHLDKYLFTIVGQYGMTTLFILFVVIFMETGLVITPFLPGDSLLFAAGALAAGGSLPLVWLYVLMILAAFLGDTVNYWIGHKIGPVAFETNHKLFKKEYLHKAHHFFEKHGNVSIVVARFIPIVRTFAPFVAGISQMSYPHFLSYNLIGGFLWVSLFLLSGYFFGNLPIVKNNFHYTVIVIVLISTLPIAWEWWKHMQEKRKAKA